MPTDEPSNGPRLSVGLLVAGSEMVSFTLFGLLLDYVLGTLPGFTIGMTLLGVVAAFYMLIRMSRGLTRNEPGRPNKGAEDTT